MRFHFGIILEAFWHTFSVSFRHQFWDAFLDASFPIFGSKWFPKRSDQKALRTLLGTPSAQRRPKGRPKMSYPPRPFSNRMPDGGPDAPKMHPGPSRVPVLEHFERISGTICNIVRSRFQVESHPVSPDPTFRGGISKQGVGGGKPPPIRGLTRPTAGRRIFSA